MTPEAAVFLPTGKLLYRGRIDNRYVRFDQERATPTQRDLKEAIQSAPFPLMTYQDVAKRSQQILEVTQQRVMPPWLPESGYGDFADNRRLTPDELGMLKQWTRAPWKETVLTCHPPPQWTSGWHLGKPDLVVTTVLMEASA